MYEFDFVTRDHSAFASFSLNSSRRESHPTITRVSSNLAVLEISLDGDKGTIILSFSVSYFDSQGRRLRHQGARRESPHKWIIEKQNGKWVLVEDIEFKMWAE